MTVDALAQEVTVLSAEDSVQLKGATEKLAYERGDFLPIKFRQTLFAKKLVKIVIKVYKKDDPNSSDKRSLLR